MSQNGLSQKQHFIGECGGVLDPSLVVHELLHADDTLLMDASGGSVEQYVRCIEKLGAKFGLTFTFLKLESMLARCADMVQSPGGGEIPTKSTMLYLGVPVRVCMGASRRLETKRITPNHFLILCGALAA